ncbi:OsmC family peroxiredoxin [Amycolatopsis jejuensis]|uniref:OsmC family peroxiredoxin n=1 Tax=Amycolatopsis jejuensis TaxID=330084 RepID=UPI0005255D7A|nr:OsmC family peroxiredoxin [Amycolatopsis jejuensis]
MPTVTRSADVHWVGNLLAGQGTLSSQSGALTDAELSFPKRTGEPDGQTSPEELLASAHAGCFAMSLASALANAGLKDSTVDVQATVSLDRVDGVFAITRSALKVEVDSPELTGARLSELVAEADQRCPLSTLLRASAEVTITAAVRALR